MDEATAKHVISKTLTVQSPFTEIQFNQMSIVFHKSYQVTLYQNIINACKMRFK